MVAFSQWWALLPIVVALIGGVLVEKYQEQRRKNRYKNR